MLSALWILGAVLPAILGAPSVGSDDEGTIWAVLVAGSNEFYNYRHQADVCHAYQIFRRHGVPDSQIIVMMYDDIAKSSDNWSKGKIFNKPNGDDVYKNVPKDYTKGAVTIKNFKYVLTGNSSGLEDVDKKKKILKSGPNDHVFINFVDHGATGMIGFPEEYMYADDLISTLKTMHSNNMFKKLVFYMEACEAGSMFYNLLPKNIEIYAATAANPSESSYATYCDTYSVCLGDEFSVAWMEDIDAEEKAGKFTKETLQGNFKKVKKNVLESHPTLYGELSIKKDEMTDFFGSENSTSFQYKHVKSPSHDRVSSRDVPVYTLTKRIERSNDRAEKTKLQKELDTLIYGRSNVDKLFNTILSSVTSVESSRLKDLETVHSPLNMEMMPCYRKLVDNFNDRCINIPKNTYVMGHLYKLANLCSRDNFSPEEVLQIYSDECTATHRALTGIN